MNPRRNPNDLNGDGVVDENDNPDPPTLGPGGIHQTHPDYQAPPPDDDGDDGGSTTQQPTGSPVGTDPGEQTPDNTIPSGTDPSTLPDGEYYDSDGNQVIVSTDSNGNTHVRESGEESGYYTRPDGTIGTFDNDGSGGYVPPGLDNPAHFSDTATPFSHDPDDDRSYVVSGDGRVVYYQGGHTYRVSDDDLADAVRTALATGDASGLSYVDRVSVYDAAGHRSASNYEHHAGSEHHAESAEEVLSEFASVDEQVEWFRGQVRNLPADPAQAAQRLTELAVIAAGLGQHWSGRDAGAPQTYFANLSEIFNASAAANQDIAQANAGLPSAPAAATPAAEIAEIRADNAALLASADDLGIGYDDRRPDFEQIRADVQESVDQQNAEYVNHYLEEDTVPSGTAPTQEQIDRASAAAVEQQVQLLESQGIDTSELTNEQVASMVAPVSAAAQRQYERELISAAESLNVSADGKSLEQLAAEVNQAAVEHRCSCWSPRASTLPD